VKQAALKGLIVGLLWGVTIVSLPHVFRFGAYLASVIDPPSGVYLNIR
jgi:hypothetical protein